MKRLSLVALLVLMFSVIGAGSAAAAQGVGMFGSVTMNAQNGSGQTGEVVLFDNGNGTTTVVVNITPGAAGVAQPAHIHEGTCANLNPAPKYPLTSVVDGKSTTTVNVSLSDLKSGTYAINIHKSGPEASTYVSCGDLTSMQMMAASGTANSMTVNLSAQNNSGQTGSALLTPTSDGKTMVVLSITPGAAGVAQPAHIHDGTCDNLNPKPKYPLNSVLDGKSVTVVNASMTELMAEPYAINVHKSGPEASVYVSCGNLTMATAAPGMPTTGNGFDYTLLAGLVALMGVMIGGGVLLRRRA